MPMPKQGYRPGLLAIVSVLAYDAFVDNSGLVKRPCLSIDKSDRACEAYCEENLRATQCAFCQCRACPFCLSPVADLALQSRAGDGLRFMKNGCSLHETIFLGGCQRPPPRKECLQRWPPSTVPAGRIPTLAVIIPFRSSHAGDLDGLCASLPEHLFERGIAFQLFLARQADTLPFNRGALVNAAIMLLLLASRAPSPPSWIAHRSFDFVAIHDADRFPVSSPHALCAGFISQYYTYPVLRPRVLHPKR